MIPSDFSISSMNGVFNVFKSEVIPVLGLKYIVLSVLSDSKTKPIMYLEIAG